MYRRCYSGHLVISTIVQILSKKLRDFLKKLPKAFFIRIFNLVFYLYQYKNKTNYVWKVNSKSKLYQWRVQNKKNKTIKGTKIKKTKTLYKTFIITIHFTSLL